ncbi:sensor histidine kinase, partial [Mycobacterium tuberculosis]
LAALADRRGIDLGLESEAGPQGAFVVAQPALLEALATNLLDNALRYTQEGGRVTVGVQRVNGAIELSVEDNGPGIP